VADLDRAIEAATDALKGTLYSCSADPTLLAEDLATIAVEAAAPHIPCQLPLTRNEAALEQRAEKAEALADCLAAALMAHDFSWIEALAAWKEARKLDP
jgi:hypothetical protein